MDREFENESLTWEVSKENEEESEWKGEKKKSHFQYSTNRLIKKKIEKVMLNETC